MPPDFVDTHCHLDDAKFRDDLPAVLARAAESGVTRALGIGIDRATSAAALDLAHRYPMLSAVVGIQPNHVSEAEPGDWECIVAMASLAEVVGIGESGLDRYWDRAPFAMQEDYFARHLSLARAVGKPLVIHNREADADTVRMLRAEFDRHGPIRAVMHSFAADAATAEASLAMGLHLSFAGMVTYKTAEALRAVAATVPDDRLLIETDAPYLAPVPVRGLRNEPAFVVHTAACLAEVRGVSVERIAEITTRNARELFGVL